MSNLVDRTTKKENSVKSNIVIHVMPRRFHSGQENIRKAKNTGLIIVALGALFLLGGIIAVYFYFIKSPSEINTSTQSQPLLQTNDTQKTIEKDNKIINTNNKTNSETEKTLSKEDSSVVNKKDDSDKIIASSSDVNISSTTSEQKNSVVSSTSPLVKINEMMADKDQDGLFDKEEVLFGCNLNISDSDKDGYKDKEELDNLYNPSGQGKIDDSPFIRRYKNESYKYSFLLPVSLSVKKFGGDDSLMINLSKNEFIQIIAQSNENKISIFEWYKKQFGSMSPENKVSFNGWEGIKKDHIVYLGDKQNNYIITISYNSGIEDVVSYPNVFELIIKSFKFIYD